MATYTPNPLPVTDNGGTLSVDDGAGSLTVDGTVTTTAQPGVDIGDVTVNNAAGAAAVNVQDGGNSLTVDATSLPLPTGAATEATLAAESAKLPATLGQKAMAASMAVVVASDQSAVPVSGQVSALVISNVIPARQTFSGSLSGGGVTVNCPEGNGGATLEVTGTWVGTLIFDYVISGATSVAIAGYKMPSGPTVTSTTTSGVFLFPQGGGTLRVYFNAYTSGTATIWWATGPSAPAVYVSGFVEIAPSTVATLTNVASSASSVQLLAANTLRKSFSVFNDSTQVLYLKFGTTASVTSYTVQIPAGAYYEPPAPFFNGRIDGIWAAANGNARVTETT